MGLEFPFNFSASLPRYINHWSKVNLGSCVIFIGKYSQLLPVFIFVLGGFFVVLFHSPVLLK